MEKVIRRNKQKKATATIKNKTKNKKYQEKIQLCIKDNNICLTFDNTFMIELKPT